MISFQTKYDAVIVGSGHNGLVAACYLAKTGLSVLILEKNAEIGGATKSQRVFEGLDAKLSVYSYLVSLFPDKIIKELGLKLRLMPRATASWTPAVQNGEYRELLLRNGAEKDNRQAFRALTGDERDYRGYQRLAEMQKRVANLAWPTLTQPLVTRQEMRGRLDPEGEEAWKSLIEEPLGLAIERLISDDLVRGMVFTDARIGVSTFPHDPSLIQNRCFLYHVIGRGTGEWLVPAGGMGSVVSELTRVAQTTGKVTVATNADVQAIDPGKGGSSVRFEIDGKEHETDARFVLCNASAEVLDRLTASSPNKPTPAVEGAGFKINMLLKRLPRLRSEHHTANEAFAGTVHIDEGYDQMQASYRQSIAGEVPDRPPGEIYCHTLTDPSILSDELAQRGFHTLTLFGLDMPYRLFEQDNNRVRSEVLAKYLAGINRYLEDPIESCLATDAHGQPCIDAKSAFDLEKEISLPKGNIFHGDLSWPFTDDPDEAGEWGVETIHSKIYLCGSAAKRGGAVSGIPGHNAAMKVIEEIRCSTSS